MSPKPLQFEKGEVALHVGGGSFAAGEEVEILAVGPWGPEKVKLADNIYNATSCDYIIVSVTNKQMAFELEPNLRKKPRDGGGDHDFIPPVIRNMFKKKETA